MRTGAGLRIVVEPSDYVLRNAGDTAMMQVAITRLARRWPEAEIAVFSDVPERFPRYAPNVTAVDAAGRRAWLRTPLVPVRLVPRRLVPLVSRASRWVRVHAPQVALGVLAVRLGADERRRARQHVRLLAQADVLLATGMGGVTDVFPEYAFELLETLDTARRTGSVTVMVGQGIGPLDDPPLRRYASSVLRGVDLIALREDRAGRPLLGHLGVDQRRVLTTGDDAIELAVDREPNAGRRDIGVNVRISDYAGLSDRVAADIMERVRTAADHLQVGLRGIAISSVPGEEDAGALARVLGAEAPTSIGPGVAWTTSLDGVIDVIDVIAGCRVVVSGSYHAAVFALAMGVPTIGLAASPYYEDKFLGLADQFGVGCDVVMLAAGDGADIADLVVHAWQEAPSTSPLLVAAARRQVDLGRGSFARIAELVEARVDRAAPAVGAVR
ncbi:MAG: polysaccharide pyruvyl transferase family protein [Ilumatobacteraceae bacterium]